MNLTSLPKYPPRQGPVACLPGKRPGLSPRATRILLDAALLLLICGLLYELRCTLATMEHPPAPPPPRPPIDFKLVQERYRKVGLLMSREAVLELLGPPTARAAREPEFQLQEEFLAHSWRDFRIPDPRFWERWVDPADDRRWVAVYFGDGKVYWVFKKGF
jgi:hypothetical protein